MLSSTPKHASACLCEKECVAAGSSPCQSALVEVMEGNSLNVVVQCANEGRCLSSFSGLPDRFHALNSSSTALSDPSYSQGRRCTCSGQPRCRSFRRGSYAVTTNAETVVWKPTVHERRSHRARYTRATDTHRHAQSRWHTKARWRSIGVGVPSGTH
jgi:hypothetical protein